MAEIPDFVIAPENIGQFSYGSVARRIWASTRNVPAHARAWQFRYDPVFVPEFTADNKLNTVIKEIVGGWRVMLTVVLDNARAQELAYMSVKQIYPAEQILPQNVSALYISSISIEIPDLNRIPTAKLAHETINFANPSPAFSISIDTDSEDSAKQVAGLLPVVTVKYLITFTAKVAQQNKITVRYRDLKSSNLYVKLNGITPQGQAYIHRDDLRDLMEGVHTTIEINGTVEAPEKFDASLADRILDKMAAKVTADQTSFNEQKWATTYNGDDLKPDTITKTVNKMVKKDQDKDEWKYDESFEGELKADVLSKVKAEIKAKKNHTGSGLKDILRNHEIHTEIEGNQVVAKSIDVQRINMSEFESDSQFTSVLAYISQLRDPVHGSVDFARSDLPGFADLHVRVAELEKHFKSVSGDTLILADEGNTKEIIRAKASGEVAIGTTTPYRRLHVEQTEIHSGGQGAGYSFANRQTPNFVEGPGAGERWVWYASNGVASLWSGGDKIVITPSGNVGIGTDRPDARFEVIGGDIHMEAGRTFYSHGRMHLHGEELLYLLNKGGVIVSKAWGGSGNLTVEGDIILGASQSLYSGGRLHINGEENLYFLNKGGVIVSKAWGGNGNLTVEGRIEGAMNKLTSGNGRFIMTLTDEGTVTMFDSQGIPGWNNSWVVWAPPQPS